MLLLIFCLALCLQDRASNQYSYTELEANDRTNNLEQGTTYPTAEQHIVVTPSQDNFS